MKFFYKISLYIITVFFALPVFAQVSNQVPVTIFPVVPNMPPVIDTTSKYVNGIKQQDISDVIARAFHKSRVAKLDSITSKPTISFVPAIGYTLVSKLALVVSGNAAFRTGPNARVSTIVLSSSITQRRQFTLPVQTSIWSKDNKYNFVGDYRFFRYPQSTFGLGSGSNIKDEDPMDYSYVQFYETVLRHITGDIYAGAGYIIDDHWNVTDKGNMDGTVSDYSTYGKMAHSISSGFTLNALLDTRDNAINPFKGAFMTLQYRDNLTALGSTTGWQSLIVDVRKYFRFPAGSDNVLALWSYDWLTLTGRPPYIDLPSTQWDESSATGRGYIQGRFRGAQMVYVESEYRYKITEDGLIGGTFFINGQSLSAAPGTKLQAMQPGYGPGLRIKLNKVSNTNISIDYGFGRQGSNGLFIDVGEIF
ncbi:hypothetical protein JN11_00390 [Mucilaginibacter frigoritolerans]|uniref:Surface antigen-like protein n=1 Tax=Mucilaginibacter frigoritolerans TaxID=652788 RepID=A0A562UFS2_9SPHI|nr:hypothetical protein [Mucilaginibacter frigoritolerans]TWJ04670.1 hypothetical protein JN11_00390 [Mucilaginibacter frigoritolerans]